MTSGLLTIIFGTSRETSDFIVDCLEEWWKDRSASHQHIRELVINLDNGPELNSHRTQFMKRLVEFSDKNNLRIRLVYYPPYHSKFNPIERCWGILEAHWNGTLLTSVEATLEWAKTMTWKGIFPTVRLCQHVYETGMSVAKKAFQAIEQRLTRSKTLPKWSLTIEPNSG
ncbi:Mobile element protein [hydrothermal vent metagenome]|uniref:Mobile element protein n=1 Tax=hydrothermal vent metagenome TaxID=652676 RepID=A0A3B1DWZ2_9ZZZZ